MFSSNLKPKEVIIEAIVTKADGTVKQLGVVSYYHQNFMKRIWWKIKNKILSLRKD